MEHLQQIEDSIMLFLQSIRNPVLSAILVPITKSGNHGYIMIALILLAIICLFTLLTTEPGEENERGGALL